MQSLTLPLVDARKEHAGWSVEITRCGDHAYMYMLVEHLPNAHRAYFSPPYLTFPEIFIALIFALQEMKQIRREQLQL
jgi:hypothetical protein